MGQTPGSPSPTRTPTRQTSRSPFQSAQQQQNNQAQAQRTVQPHNQNYQAQAQRTIQPHNQNYQAQAQRTIQPPNQAQEPYHPPYERQTLVQQARQQQQQQPSGYQSYPQHLDEREPQQLYSNPGNQQPYQETFQQYQHGGVQQQQYGQQAQPYHHGQGQQQQYGQQAQPYHGQAQHPQQNPSQSDAQYSNPKTAFFHVEFKGLAIFLYIFGGWMTSSFALLFVLIVVLVAFDFWTVKNVSGRILVGLRYWNENDQHGNSIWRFESLDRQILERLNKNDTVSFWTSLYVTPGIWSLFALVALLKFNFDFLMIDLIALTMCASNIVGFTKCHKESKKKVQSFAEQAMGGFMREAMTAGITNNLSKVLNTF